MWSKCCFVLLCEYFCHSFAVLMYFQQLLYTYACALGVCVKDRWRELLQVTLPHTDDHVTMFNDLHFLMVSLGAKETAAAQRLLEGLQELAK